MGLAGVVINIDLGKAAAIGIARLYEELLGFTYAREKEVGGEAVARLIGLPNPVRLKIMYLSREGLTVELFQCLEPKPSPRSNRALNEPGLSHIALLVDDIDELLSKVPSYGGQVLEDTKGPILEDTEADDALFIRDPDGQLIELLPPEAM